MFRRFGRRRRGRAVSLLAPDNPVMYDEDDPNTWYPNEPIPELRAHERHLMMPDEARRVEKELRDHFRENETWRTEKILGGGSQSNRLVLVSRRNPRSGRYQRLAVKRAMTNKAEEELRTEILHLGRQVNAQHIATMIAARDDPVPEEVTVEVLTNKFQQLLKKATPRRRRLYKLNDPRRVGKELGLKSFVGWPVLVLEYLEHGTLYQLIMRANQNGVVFPNRMLWHIYLCLLRACLALAYPAPAGQPPAVDITGAPKIQLETITKEPDQATLWDRSLNIFKVMLGSTGGKWPEHDLVPVSKIIDLGAAIEDQRGLAENLYSITHIMYCLITRETNPNFVSGPTESVWTRGSAIIPTEHNDPYPHIDIDLRTIVAKGLAVMPEERPALPNVAHGVWRGFNKPVEAYAFPQQIHENDMSIKVFVHNLIFDADISTTDPANPAVI
ncbi:hypothetical protein M426DRAFT_20312 [Hypoxylon sp. CI-4A]|nr:hypothetical protein M426DRAFT_20312 [Hypoxylon sp. CI-4A]